MASSFVGSRLISTIAGSARTIPTTASAEGRSPSITPALIGTRADITAETGADLSQADGNMEFRATKEADLYRIQAGNERYFDGLLKAGLPP